MGLTQYQLADELGISQNQISSYERANSTPTVETLAKMAALFNTSADYLLGLSNIPHPDAEPDPHPDLTGLERDALALIQGRDDDFLRKLIAVLKILS